jgi:hypothetical protein
MVEGEALIRNQAKAILYRDVIRDQDGMMLAKDAGLEALQALERRTNAKVMTGRVSAWCG